MSKRTIIGLLALNLCLFGAQLSFAPGSAEAQLSERSDAIDAGAGELHDCCKKSQEDRWFCCDQCCTSENCDVDSDCPV